MSAIHDHPAAAPAPARPDFARWLLACGPIAALISTGLQDLLGLLWYEGYDQESQAVSELTALGAPSWDAILFVGLLSNACLIAFAVGVWRVAAGNRLLRAVAVLLIIYGALGPLWLPFPMTAHGDITPTPALSDVMHVALGAATVLVIVATISTGAFALGRWFRVYSLVTLAAVLAAGFAMFSTVPLVNAGEPTPGLGIAERVNNGAWLLRVTVLAIALWRRTSPVTADEEAAPRPGA